MKATYYKDTMHSYMVISCPPEAETTGYQYRMLEMNRIEGILPCGIRHIDGEGLLYYEVTGKQSLSGLYEGRKIPGEELFKLLKTMEQVSATLAGYLLDEQHLVLTGDQIFYDFASGSYSFTYYPGEVTEADVFRFLADGIDGKDKTAAAAAFRLCAAAQKDRQALREAVRTETGQRETPKYWESEYEEEVRKKSAEENEGGFVSEPDSPEPDRYSKRGELNRYSEREESNRYSERQESNLYSERQGSNRGESADSAKTSERAATKMPDSGKRRVVIRILLIILLLAGAGGLFAVQLLIYITRRERRLCIAGSILLVISALLIMAEMILGSRERNRKRREEKSSREPCYRESDEKDIPVLRNAAAEDYRLKEDEVNYTVRLGEHDGVGRLYGRDRGNRIDLRTLPVTVGKARAYSDAVLSDPSVSRVHARIYKGEEGCIEIRDLDSTNGTFINGTRLAPNEKRRVQRGDEVRFGNVEYEYR